MTTVDIMTPLNRAFRDHRRYTGDGLASEPTGAPLPVGDPASGVHSPDKPSIRSAFTEVQTALQAAVDAAEAAPPFDPALANWTPPGSGAQETTVENALKNYGYISIFAHMAADLQTKVSLRTATSGDATAITAAIDSVFTYAASVGRKVLAHAGLYLINATIGWGITAGFAIECEPGTVFRADSSFPVDNKMFLPSATSGEQKFVWRGGQIDGRSMPARISGAPDLLYIASQYIDYVEIDGVHFLCNDDRNGTAGDSCLFLSSGDDYMVTNCVFQGAVDAGLYISGDATQTLGRRCIVQGNVFKACQSVGFISKRLFQDHVIDSNMVFNCNSGIVVGGEADTTLLPGTKAVISGNLIRNVARGIEARIADGTVITGNRIEDYGVDATGTAVADHGIKISGSDGCVVSGNVIVQVTVTPSESAAIHIDTRTYDSVTYSADGNIVVGNRIAVAATGVFESAACNSTIITDNSITGANARIDQRGTASMHTDFTGTLRHFFGESGAAPVSAATVSYENSSNLLIQYLAPSVNEITWLVGDESNNVVARMSYFHSVDRWAWRAGGSGEVFGIDSAGPRMGTHSALAGETVTGYITVKDLGGTTRKLAVVS
jgi:hypothetical protein